MTHFPPPAEELRLVDAELGRLDARRAQLLARRGWLIAVLRQHPAPPAPPLPRMAAAAVKPAKDTTAPRVQNVLLVLGGVLLTVAAMAFTLVGWGHLGIAGRGLVLGAVTLGALAAPVPLLRRGLTSTAESLAGLGLALTVLDVYALHETVFADTDGTGYAAVASALLAAVWAAYGHLLRTVRPPRPAEPSPADPRSPRPAEAGAPVGPAGLRLPLPAALGAAQLPLLLWAVAAATGPWGITTALLLTGGFDTVLALRARTGYLRVTAAVGACALGGWGALAAGLLAWTAAGPADAVRGAALLLLAAGIALATAGRLPAPKAATGAALGAGLLTVAALGSVPHAVLPGTWTVPVHLAWGVALPAVARTGRLPEAVRQGLARASAVVQGLAVLWALPAVVVVLLGPVGWATRAWSGAPDDVRAAVTADLPWPPHAVTAPLVLAVVAGFLAVTVRDPAWRPRALAGALPLAWAAALVLPAALELPYAVGLVTEGVATAGLVLLAHGVTRTPAATTATGPSSSAGSSSSAGPPATATPITVGGPTAPSDPTSQAPRAPHGPHAPTTPTAPFPSPLLIPVTATVLALVTSAGLALLALASEAATLVVLAFLTALFAAVPRRPAPAAAAGGYATALACAVGASLDWQPQHTALLVLAAPAAGALVAPRVTGAARYAVEVTGAASALVGVGLAVTDPPMLALVLALCGVIAAGTAVRPDRRQAGYAAAALFVLAGWVRLASWGVGTPEAYTLPVAVPALVVGVLRRRRDPLTSSWTAYGPGLATGLLPSLGAAWSDPHWPRPLLLGAAALLLTLLGARHRLRAPLLLGGAVLALDALHELAPYLVQVTDALPRWVPPALAGLLLLAVGATYEQRLRDVRRVRDLLGRMH
ncbi:SCO7613 C-terminal domain-containing membrane protein [Streptomyces sp. NPDC096152]|uniref:SCO7613 C-terminal domain-containing membrane protein n=1 Tax=Streptomyces sp. NPDC096152 TaxID=3366078 RepID=UPI0038213DC7